MNTGRIVSLVRQAIGLFNSATREQRRRSRSSGDSSSSSDSRSSGSTPSTRSSGRDSRPTNSDRRTPEDRDRRPAGRTEPIPGRDRPSGSGGSPTPVGPAASADSELAGARIEYSPALDGDADPGEVVWTWVPYEDDPSQGKDRPVMIFGRRGRLLVGVALTSKRHDNEPQIAVGTGPWDREGRTSYAKLERILDVDPAKVRREGAVLPQDRFDDVVRALQQLHGLVERPR